MISKTRPDLESVGVSLHFCLFLFLSVLVYDRDVAIAIIIHLYVQYCSSVIAYRYLKKMLFIYGMETQIYRVH